MIISKIVEICIDSIKSFAVFYKNRELIYHLLRRQVGQQFKGTVLGALWMFAKPLLVLLVYTFVFGIIWPRDDNSAPLGSYAMLMFCGVATFNVFSMSLLSASRSIIDRRNFVLQLVFPLETLPLVQVLASLVMTLTWYLLLFSGVFLVYGSIPMTAALLPVVLLPLIFLSAGLSWLVASISVYVRDLVQFLPVVLQFLFFVTPIFWQVDLLAGRDAARFIPYLYLNPLTGIVETVRDVVVRGALPDWHVLMWESIVGCVVWLMGYAWFMQTKKGFADVI